MNFYGAFKIISIASIFAMGVSCDKAQSENSKEASLKAFARFSKKHKIPVPDSAQEKVSLETPGCTNGWNFKISVPFKSSQVIEFYGKTFKEFGMKKSRMQSDDSGFWFQRVSPMPLDSGAQIQTSQEVYISRDKFVQCSVSLLYKENRNDASKDSLVWHGERQTVSASCMPNLEPQNNPCNALR